MDALRVMITGKVQGVFFRAESKQRADELGLKGWVKNNPDGSVEIHAEGNSESLKKFEDWCHRGPEAAVVENVSVENVAPTNFSEFAILF